MRTDPFLDSGFTLLGVDVSGQTALIVATAADVHLYRVVPESVKVTITGSPDVIAVLQANQIRATVDLTGVDAARDFKRNVEVSVPAGVTVVSVEPAKVGVIVPPAPVTK